MKTYEVKIFKNGALVDTQVVQDTTEGGAKSTAMALTKISFRGEQVTYEVREVK